MQFIVYGKPATAGDKRVYGPKRVAPADPHAHVWRGQVIDTAIDAMGSRPMLTGDVATSCVFFIPRPKGHYYDKGKRAGQLKSSAPKRPGNRTGRDIDKLIRAMHDALQGVVYADDSQICTAVQVKEWSRTGQHATIMGVWTIPDDADGWEHLSGEMDQLHWSDDYAKFSERFQRSTPAQLMKRGQPAPSSLLPGFEETVEAFGGTKAELKLPAQTGQTEPAR